MPGARYDLDINLGDYQSIQKAEKFFGKLSAEVDEALELAMNDTGEKMYEKAIETLTSYNIGSGKLASSLELSTGSDGITLQAGTNHADYVEFGTGIRGAETPHPKPENWEYDINGHGEAGWYYYDENHKRHWTSGMPSRPYMYTSWLYGSRIIGSQVTRRINQLIKEAGL